MRGSPSKPNCLPWVCCVTSASSTPTGMLRAAATRGSWKSALAGEMSGSRPEADVTGGLGLDQSAGHLRINGKLPGTPIGRADVDS